MTKEEKMSVPERRKTVNVRVGEVMIGSDYPIRIQTMANVSSNDIEAAAGQAMRCAVEGAELFRFTTQGEREVSNVGQIRERLRCLGCKMPLVADVHFRSDVADKAATVVEKVRINPGNYIDPARKFVHLDYTEDTYRAELERLRNRFEQLLTICRTHHSSCGLPKSKILGT